MQKVTEVLRAGGYRGTARILTGRLLLAVTTILVGTFLLFGALMLAAPTPIASADVMAPEFVPNSQPAGVDNVTILLGKEVAPPPNGIYLVGDTIVFTITVENQAGNGGTALLVPLTDVYSPTWLSYVSASPAPTAAASGVITWNNVGPIADRAGTTVVVTFTALASGVTTNTAIIQGVIYNSYPAGYRDPDPAYATVDIYDADWGDAPDPTYPTLRINNGARHVITGTLRLGATIDAEANGQPNATATGDDLANLADEDGISFLTPLVPGQQATLGIVSSTAGKLDAWIDWNGDGDWNDAGEQIFTSISLLGGPMAVNITVPANAKLGLTFARFRVSSAGGLAPTGLAMDGEVEDYQLTVVPGGAIGDYVWYDANGDGRQDVGEPGIGNVTLALHDSFGNVVTTTTGADGGYLFPNLLAGVYFVDVTDARGILTGLTHTSGPQSLPDPTGPFTLTTGQTNRDVDFGYRRVPTAGTAVVGDTVWWDTNQNGTLDPGEAGIGGVTVNLVRVSDAAIISTTVTNPNGVYLFTNVAPGIYTVDAVNPPGSPDPAAPDPTAIFTVSAGQIYLDADIGRLLPANPAIIGGTVWNDTILNPGLLDLSEPRLPGVSVDLIYDANNNNVIDPGEIISATTTTDSNGVYTFTVPAGNYLIRVSDTTNTLANYTVGPLGPTPGADNNNQAQPYPVKLPAGGTNTTADFGYTKDDPLLGKIGNQVWVETDRDGLFEPANGENGIEGVTVLLRNTGTGLVYTTTTSASGDYVFTSLPAGTYTVTVTDQFGILTGYSVTALGAAGVDFNNQAQPYTITLAAGGENMTADFGYILPGAAIGDYVWYDTNTNGLQDVGEPGIGNVTVALYQGGVVLQTTTTDANGGYLFAGLRSGTYTVTVTDLNGVLTGYNHTVGPESLTNPTGPIVLGPTDVYRDADFGYLQPTNPGTAVIGDTVWWDTNSNGVRDPSELGIPNTTVQLINVATGLPVASTTTDQNGNYLFANVTPGAYYVDVTTPPAGGTPSPAAPDPTAPFTVSAGQQYLDADIGFVPTSPATIGGTVWNDTTPNGILAGEPGIPGVTVDLLNPNGVIIATTTTDSSGNYTFTVPAGSYLVQVSDTHNVLDDFTDGPLGPTPGADNNNQTQPYPVTATAGVPNTTADFGYIQNGVPGQLGIIGNQVWVETDRDGLYEPLNGEVGIAGVTVQLRNAADTVVISTTVTGADGGYIFTSLPDGAYTVRVNDAFGILTGYDPTLIVGGTADNTNKVQGYSVTLAPASRINMTADFGYILPGAAIGDYVWYDTNTNGLQNVGEPGIGNVTVALYQGGVVLQTTTTDANGGYLFAGLRSGTYTVTVTDLNGVLTGYNHTVGSESLTNPTGPIVLGPTDIYRDADFGYIQPTTPGTAVIGDTVWWDINQNGVRDPSELGIPGVTVELKNSVNTVISTTVTDQNGNYLFANVTPGTYYVDAVTPPGNPDPAAPDPTIQFTVLAGQQYLNADIGRVPASPATIGGTVWNDTTPNGVLAGEPGIPSVTVDLLNPSGVIIATTTTDSSGNYTFTVPAGSYLVQVSDTHNVLDDFTVGPLGPTPGADNNNQTQPYPVTATAGVPNTTADFGYIQNGVPGQLGIIGNQVWVETDRDGLYEPLNGEVGIAGVTVDLLNAAGQVISTTVTGADGGYVFTSLPAATYRVVVNDAYGVLTNYVVTTLGPVPSADNNNQQQPYTVTLPADGINPTADFGYVEAYVDLVLTKNDGGISTVPGGIVTYTLSYTNAGTIEALETVITETLPANSAFAGPVDWIGSGSTYTYTVGYLGAGASGSVQFAVTVSNPLTAGVTQINNIAIIGDDGSHGPDRNPGDNEARDSTPVAAGVDLRLNKTDGDITTVPGGTVVYTLTYTNDGTQGATGVVITETLPANSAFAATASLPTSWTAVGGGLYTTPIGAVAGGGGTGTVRFAVTVNNPLPAGVNMITNTARISDDGATGPDPTPLNNIATVDTPVNAAPDLYIVKDDGGITTKPGGIVTYTLSYGNGRLGNQDATGVIITDTIPAHTTFTPTLSTAGWSCLNNNPGTVCTFTVGNLALGATGSVNFVITVDNFVTTSLTLVNFAFISDNGANGADLNPLDNSDGDTTPVSPPTAIQFASFTGRRVGNGVRLEWSTLSELDITGFNVYRASSPKYHGDRVNATLIPAAGLPDSSGQYNAFDAGVTSGEPVYYWLEAVGANTTQWFGPIAPRWDSRVYLPLSNR